MHCNVCSERSVSQFKTLVLKKYNVEYFKCTSCGFIQTEDPYWLGEAYESAITDLDIGLVSRNLYFAEILEGFFDRGIFNEKGIFLDYAGGYGLFVRLMRDKGINFFRQDVYCKNIFADHFDLSDLSEEQHFDAITAFEVFEHLVDPLEGVAKMLTFSDTIIFSTQLQPEGYLTPDNWWYFVPETGQHVSLYTIKSLENIARREGLYFYSNKQNLHIYSKKALDVNPFEKAKMSFLQKLNNKVKDRLRAGDQKPKRESLILKDFNFINGLDKDEVTS